MGWKPGDRVEVCLPVKIVKYSRGQWISGTVREVNPAGLRPGVRVDLDHEVNGVRNCYATHSELRPAGR
jgi:hypothetical protein